MINNGNPTTSNNIGAKIKAPQGVKRDQSPPSIGHGHGNARKPGSQKDRKPGFMAQDAISNM